MLDNNKLKIKIIEYTPFGSMAIIWDFIDDFPNIMHILIPMPHIEIKERISANFPNSEIYSCKEIDDLSGDIVKFLNGDKIEFSMDLLYWDICSPFQEKVLRAKYQIPWGSLTTYQLLAKHLGRLGGARAVGNALANNPFPIIIPCHRTIRSDGTLGGFQGGLDMKKKLLENEGISFQKNNKVAIKKFHFQIDMDQNLLI